MRDIERVLMAKRWKIGKKVKEQTRTTELLIKQGVVRLQSMWWVEYQRVKEDKGGKEISSGQWLFVIWKMKE